MGPGSQREGATWGPVTRRFGFSGPGVGTDSPHFSLAPVHGPYSEGEELEKTGFVHLQNTSQVEADGEEAVPSQPSGAGGGVPREADPGRS